MGEEGQQVGKALGVPVPLSVHQPVSGSPHISTREYADSGLKIGRCSDSIRGREEKGQDGRWMEPPFVLLINAFVEKLWVTLMRGAAQMLSLIHI